MRITDQYFWNFVFSVFFLILIIMGAIILDTEARMGWNELTAIDFILMTLASWRLTRLFVYDHITKWLREQFYDVKKVGRGYTLERPKSGPRRTIADLCSCPWCMGVWLSSLVVFIYMLTDYAYYFAIFLSISAVATFLQILTNLVGWQAEKIKMEVER